MACTSCSYVQGTSADHQWQSDWLLRTPLAAISAISVLQALERMR
jgi:hypothetical protein